MKKIKQNYKYINIIIAMGVVILLLISSLIVVSVKLNNRSTEISELNLEIVDVYDIVAILFEGILDSPTYCATLISYNIQYELDDAIYKIENRDIQ